MAYNVLQRGQWQTRGILNGQHQVMWQKGGCKVGETSLMLNVKWHGREEDSGRPGEASSIVDVGWCAKAEGVKMWQTRGGILEVAERRAEANWGRCSQCSISSDVSEQKIVRAVGGEASIYVVWEVFPNLAHIFWGRGTGDQGGRWR